MLFITYSGRDNLGRNIFINHFHYIHENFLRFYPNNPYFHPKLINFLVAVSIEVRISYYFFSYKTVRKILYETAKELDFLSHIPKEDLKILIKYSMWFSCDVISEDELDEIILGESDTDTSSITSQ